MWYKILAQLTQSGCGKYRIEIFEFCQLWIALPRHICWMEEIARNIITSGLYIQSATREADVLVFGGPTKETDYVELSSPIHSAQESSIFMLKIPMNVCRQTHKNRHISNAIQWPNTSSSCCKHTLCHCTAISRNRLEQLFKFILQIIKCIHNSHLIVHWARDEVTFGMCLIIFQK